MHSFLTEVFRRYVSDVHERHHLIGHDDAHEFGRRDVQLHHGGVARPYRVGGIGFRDMGHQMDIAEVQAYPLTKKLVVLTACLLFGMSFSFPTLAYDSIGGNPYDSGSIVSTWLYRYSTNESDANNWRPSGFRIYGNSNETLCGLRIYNDRGPQVWSTSTGQTFFELTRVTTSTEPENGEVLWNYATTTLSFQPQDTSPPIENNGMYLSIQPCIPLYHESELGYEYWLNYTFDNPSTEIGNLLMSVYSSTTESTIQRYTYYQGLHHYDYYKENYIKYGFSSVSSSLEGSHAFALGNVSMPTSTYDGTFSEYVPSVTFVGTSTFTGYKYISGSLDSMAGNATSVLPLCIAYPFFSFLDGLLYSLGKNDNSIQIVSFGTTSTISLGSATTTFESIGLSRVWQRSMDFVIALAWLAFGVFVFKDLFETQETQAE